MFSLARAREKTAHTTTRKQALAFFVFSQHACLKLLYLGTWTFWFGGLCCRYVKEAKAALAHLAHVCMAADKYRPETCCVVGNYYSLKVHTPHPDDGRATRAL